MILLRLVWQNVFLKGVFKCTIVPTNCEHLWSSFGKCTNEEDEFFDLLQMMVLCKWWFPWDFFFVEIIDFFFHHSKWCNFEHQKKKNFLFISMESMWNQSVHWWTELVFISYDFLKGFLLNSFQVEEHRLTDNFENFNMNKHEYSKNVLRKILLISIFDWFSIFSDGVEHLLVCCSWLKNLRNWS